MSILATVAAGLLMTPANVATDVSQLPSLAQPDYDWQIQKAVLQVGTEIKAPQKMASVNGTQSYVGQTLTIDDWRTWD